MRATGIARSARGHAPDYFFLALVFILVLVGLIMLSSASSEIGKIKFNDTYYYIKHQIFYGLSLGIVGFLLATSVRYKTIERLAVPLLAASIVALILVFTPLGLTHAGAKRWLDIGQFSIQPSELLKLTFIIYVAAWLGSSANKAERRNSLTRGFLPLLIMSVIVGFLIIVQPSTTTAVIIVGAALMMYFASGARMRYLAGLILAALLMLGIVIAATPYRAQRILTFLNPQNNLESSSYQINQALISIGSGGFFGVGYGKSTSKVNFLPEPIGDSIFAVIAEELGFVGAGGVIILFLLLVMRGISIARHSRNEFARLTATGLISVAGIQAFINIAAISGIMPLTGIPLPFISYGGTGLAIFLTMMGVVANISRYT